MANGLTEVGVLGERPHVGEKPVTDWVFKPPEIVGSVGALGMPASTRILSPARLKGLRLAWLQVKPIRASSADVGVRTMVYPAATCWLAWYVFPLDWPKSGPGIGEGSTTLAARLL